MKIHRKITITALIMASIPFSGIHAEDLKQTYKLSDLYRLAAKHSEQIQIAKENLYISEKDKSRALAVLVPRLTAFGKYRNDDLKQENSPASATTPADLNQDTDTTTWGVSLNQSFTLNGRELAALSMSKKAIEKSEYDLRSEKENTLFSVAAAYYRVLQAKKGLEIALASVRRMEKHKKEIEARLLLEDVTKTDLYRVESELSDAKSYHIDARNSLQSARTALKTLVPLSDDFELGEPSASTDDITGLGLDDLRRKSLKQRSLIKSTELDYKISKDNIRIKRGDYWPKIELEGQYAKSDVSEDTRTAGSRTEKETENQVFSVEASLTFTIFDGGLRRAEMKQAKSRKRQALLALEGKRKEIKLEVENTYLEVRTQKSKLKALSDKLKYSGQNYKAVAEQFKHGLTDSVDLMDANTLLVSAERELAAAEYEYKLAALKLKKVTGTFLEETGLEL